MTNRCSRLYRLPRIGSSLTLTNVLCECVFLCHTVGLGLCFAVCSPSIPFTRGVLWYCSAMVTGIKADSLTDPIVQSTSNVEIPTLRKTLQSHHLSFYLSYSRHAGTQAHLRKLKQMRAESSSGTLKKNVLHVIGVYGDMDPLKLLKCVTQSMYYNSSSTIGIGMQPANNYCKVQHIIPNASTYC